MRVILLGLLLAVPLSAAEKFDLVDGDRVVLIGNTLIEREQRHGWWETALTASRPDRHVVFRNLGWAGDTVWAESRGSFDPPEKGFQRLIEGVKGLKPTVVIIAYGTNESFAGEKGLPRFRQGLDRLLDALAPTKARVVLLSPLPLESSDARPDVKDANRDVALYSAEIGRIAEKRNAVFVDLFSAITAEKSDKNLTDNGLHPTEEGYLRTSAHLTKLLGLTPLKDAGDPRVEKLRTTIVEKNRLYFHRWRPQNETYIFGFRKPEQGRNAREIPMFDPLVEEQEKEIAKLRSALTKQ